MEVLSAKEISELIVAIIGIGGLITTPLVALRTHDTAVGTLKLICKLGFKITKE